MSSIKFTFFLENVSVGKNTECQIEYWKKQTKNLASENSLQKTLQKKSVPEDQVLNFILTSDQHIQELNFKYRKKNTATDVLTFTYEEKEAPLADIFISLNTADEQAIQENIPLGEELIRLGVHGILHALGFDHERSSEECLLMHQKEQEILSSIGLTNRLPITNHEKYIRT